MKTKKQSRIKQVFDYDAKLNVILNLENAFFCKIKIKII